jgi:hypothetical protein
MDIQLKNKVDIVKLGSHYKLPTYRLNKEDRATEIVGDIDIRIIDGSQDEIGTFHEHLLVMMITDLKHKNSLVPSRDTSMVITN